jgi:hypothetical protein
MDCAINNRSGDRSLIEALANYISRSGVAPDRSGTLRLMLATLDYESSKGKVP